MPTASTTSFRRAAGGVAVLALAVALAWGGTRANGFVWDDDFFIVSNAALRHLDNVPRFFWDPDTTAGRGMAADFRIFRPLRNLSYALDYRLVGLAPAWWHLHQLLLHTLNAALLAGLARRAGLRADAALVAGLVFALHPAQSEAVAWVKCRDDLLAAAFSLGAIWVWSGGPAGARPRPRVATTAGLVLLACLAKEQAVVLPLVLTSWDAAFPRQRSMEPGSAGAAARARLCWRQIAVLTVPVVVYVAWRQAFIGRLSQTESLAGNGWDTMLTMVVAFAGYVRLLLFPARLLADYAGMAAIHSLRDPAFLGSLALVAAVGAGLWALRRRAEIAVGLLWTLLFLAPVSNVVPMMQYMAERFLYLPMIGFALAAGFAWDGLRRRAPRCAMLAAVGVLAAAGLRAHARVPVWHDAVALHRTTYEDSGRRAFRQGKCLLAALLSAGRVHEAAPLARELLARAERDPQARQDAVVRAELHRRLGLALVRLGQREDGRAHLLKAGDLDPINAGIRVDLALVDAEAADPAAALAWLDRAEALEPGSPLVAHNRGIALQALGRNGEAEAALRRAAAGSDADPAAHLALAALLWGEGRVAETIPIYRDALRLDPRNAEARRWLLAAQESGAPAR